PARRDARRRHHGGRVSRDGCRGGEVSPRRARPTHRLLTTFTGWTVLLSQVERLGHDPPGAGRVGARGGGFDVVAPRGARLVAGWILLTAPTVMYGGMTLLGLLTKALPDTLPRIWRSMMSSGCSSARDTPTRGLDRVVPGALGVARLGHAIARHEVVGPHQGA